MAWRVGMKAVCVDAESNLGLPNASWGADIPVEGEVYTVIDVLDCFGMEGLAFKEIRNTPEWKYAYNSARFRPAVEKKTDISALTAIADGSRRVQIVDPVWERAMADAYQGYQPDYIERRRK